jgi:hypothetical protein
MALFLFVRVGWMRWYRGPQPDDLKPIGGGRHNVRSIGHEVFNFLAIDGRVRAHCLPVLRPHERAQKSPPSVRLERIQSGYSGDALGGVLAVFVATHPKLGSQRIIGWYRNATVYRHERLSTAKERNSFPYSIETLAQEAVLVPEARRSFIIPRGKGAFGEANVCYALNSDGSPKNGAQWMDEAVEYLSSYALENAAQRPESETDATIDETIGSTIEHAAGFQSDPQIRQVIEKYAMDWAERRLKELFGATPENKSKTKPYDFLCKVTDSELYVEVKGTQETAGKIIGLTPNEVDHATQHRNSALFIVYAVKVEVNNKKPPVVSEGRERFVNPWDISKGTLKPRGYVFTVTT